jgi:hypothetical protein
MKKKKFFFFLPQALIFRDAILNENLLLIHSYIILKHKLLLYVEGI